MRQNEVKWIKTWFFECKLFEIRHFANFLIQNLTPCFISILNLTRKNFSSISDALENFNSKSDKFSNFFSESWFSSCFSGSDWMMISSVNVNTNLFWREVKDNVSLNMSGIALSQHTFSTKVMDRTLWSIKSSRSGVFLKLNFCENIRKRTLVRIPSIFSNVFMWATRRAMERSWLLHSIYTILAAGRFLPQSWHLSKLTMLNRKSNFETYVAQNIT